MIFKVRKNKHGYFIGSEDSGNHRVTYYMQSEPKVGSIIPILVPLPHHKIMYQMVENDFLVWTDSRYLEDNITLYDAHYAYLMALNKETFTYKQIEEDSNTKDKLGE